MALGELGERELKEDPAQGTPAPRQAPPGLWVLLGRPALSKNRPRSLQETELEGSRPLPVYWL